MAEHEPTQPAVHDGRFGARFDDEVQVSGVFAVAAGIALTAVLGMIATLVIWKGFAESAETTTPPAVALPVPPRLPAGVPLLQQHPEGELTAMREEMARELEGWAWTDETKTTVRVPVEVAMELLLARGLPARPATDAAPTGEAAEEVPATGAPALPAADPRTGHGG